MEGEKYVSMCVSGHSEQVSTPQSVGLWTDRKQVWVWFLPGTWPCTAPQASAPHTCYTPSWRLTPHTFRPRTRSDHLLRATAVLLQPSSMSQIHTDSSVSFRNPTCLTNVLGFTVGELLSSKHFWFRDTCTSLSHGFKKFQFFCFSNSPFHPT